MDMARIRKKAGKDGETPKTNAAQAMCRISAISSFKGTPEHILKACREAIDYADADMITTLAHRMKLALEAKKAKDRLSLPLRNNGREEEVLENVKEMAKELGLPPAKIESIWRQVIGICVDAESGN